MPFGAERLVDPSTPEPRTDLFFGHMHYLTHDSAMERKGDRGDIRNASSHRDRKKHNLQDSQGNTLNPEWFDKPDCSRPPVAADEDPKYSTRRGYEKNFSDLFGTEMPARGQVRGNRRDMTTSQTSTYLDARNETADRNRDHCRGNSDFTTTAGDRKSTFLASSLNGHECPQADKSAELQRLLDEERTCSDSKATKNGSNQKNSELARRFRMKESHPVGGTVDVHYAFDMKQQNLGSSSMRAGFHQETSYAALRPASRSNEGYSTSVPVHGVPYHGAHGRVPSRQARQAFLASSIPFAFADHKSNL